ncbi:MAG TPA: GyrI-like domain-containing protein [Pyrinomonadaceae bacterium]|nr:GyrI-like domain-containing protein [Pyrinomonadaceae bacterium]
MKPISKQISSFRVGGINVRTANRNEASPETARLGTLWGRFFQEGIPGKVADRVPDSPVYGVYSDYESDVNGQYSVTAGMQIEPSATGGDSFTHVDVASGEYLVFEGKGPIPQVVIETWKTVWDYFAEAREFKRAYTTDFELYKGMDEVAIHISVSQNRPQ